MNYSTLSLFDGLEPGGPGNPARSDLAILPEKDGALSKNQRAFNRLTKRIEQLQITIRLDAARLEVLLKIYLDEIPALKQSVAGQRVSLAKALGGTAKTISFGKRQLEKVRAAILDLCSQAFAEIDPDEETERFYDEWSAFSYQEELQGQRDMMKRIVAEEARRAFGVNIKAEDIDDSPEGFARIMNRLKEEAMNGNGAGGGRSAGRKKTKKQFEREEAKQQEEALKLKSLRAIYLSLAKALHPDTILDPAEKARKEELMKNVTAAYSAGDLTTLLKLEMEWVSAEQNALKSLPEEKLKLYIASLKEQVAALEQELAMTHHNPRYQCIAEFSHYPEAQARREIRALARQYRKALKVYRDAVTMLELPAPKKEILQFVDDYLLAASPDLSYPPGFVTDV